MSANSTQTNNDGLGRDAANQAYVAWKSWSVPSFGKFDQTAAAYFSEETIDLIDPINRRRVCEIGFGNGAFLGWALATGLEYHGVEINEILRARGGDLVPNIYSSVFDGNLERLAGTFDCIVAFDVLEHVKLSALTPFLAQVSRLLKPGGHFLARVPNGDSPFGRLYQYGDITHVTVLGRFRIAQLAGLCGLSLVAVRSPAYPLKGLGQRIWITRAVTRATRNVLERIVAWLYFDSVRVPLEPNHVLVMRRPTESTE